MQYPWILNFVAVAATANIAEIIAYEKLRNLCAEDEFFNSYGTLDKIRILDLEISAVDESYQQNWAAENIAAYETIKSSLLSAESNTKAIVLYVRCEHNKPDILCRQLLA